MKALVTGSNGFIGSHLVEALLERDYEVKCLVRKTSNLHWIKHLPVHLVYGDVTKPDSLDDAVEDVNIVFHLGGVVRALNWNEFYRVNVQGTENLLNACLRRRKKIKRFVYISSQAAVGPSPDGRMITETDEPKPISLYGKSKREAEILVWKNRNQLPVTILRPPSVYGPRDDDILEIFKYVKWRIKPKIGKKERRISIVYIDDLVRGIALAAESAKGENQIFFLTDKPCDWSYFEDKIAEVMCRKTISVIIPETGVKIAAFVSELIARAKNKPALLNMDKVREMKEQFWLVDGSKAEKLLGFKPQVNLEQGIEQTYSWYRQIGWL